MYVAGSIIRVYSKNMAVLSKAIANGVLKPLLVCHYVVQGYKYKLKAVYAHFPINVNVNNHVDVEIRNFLGEKIVRKIKMLDGVKCGVVAGAKDEIEVYVCCLKIYLYV